ncbi:MAG: NUDIX domain-containing protein [Candidatus Pacebacteria bacterium]|jgi:8-oxo-dGTP pyrophosphatase MutT (NUDIX family)|nr:NUDIX domain-containing protein [Candidatus Paceibacterota bacterium]
MTVKFEKSAGAVIFREEFGEKKFLLLHYPSMAHRSKKDYWDYVKGHVEKDENGPDTVVREAEEETGIKDLEFAPGFRVSMKYFFRCKSNLIFKVVDFWLAKTQTAAVRLSGEHNDFTWLSYKEAYEMLSFKNAKEVLKKANDFLQKNEKIS